MTPRATLPKAALAAVRDAQTAIEAAAQLLRELLRRRPQDTEVSAALSHLARAETRCGEALQATKGGSMEEPKRTRQVPGVVRAVHYRAPSGVCMAAVITAVDRPGDPESPVSLTIWPPGGGSLGRSHVPHGDAVEQWHWPEQVPPV